MLVLSLFRRATINTTTTTTTTQGLVVMEPFLRSFRSWGLSRCEAGVFFFFKAAHEFAGTNVVLAASPTSPPNMPLHHHSHCPIPFFHHNICFC